MRARLAKEPLEPLVKVRLSEGEPLEAVAQRLVGMVLADPPPVTYREIDGETQEVVLDLRLDGVRCLVTRPAPRPDRARVVLSPREREISRMVAKGYANKTIAAVLDISSWTVCTYLRRIFAKLGVGSRAAMVARLLEDGILNGSPPSGLPDRSARRLP